MQALPFRSARFRAQASLRRHRARKLKPAPVNTDGAGPEICQ